MKLYLHFIFYIFTLIFLSACTGKELKKYGGNLAVNGGGGNAIMAGVGLAVGGTLYGIGSMVDDEKKKESKEDYSHELRQRNYYKNGEIINE